MNQKKILVVGSEGMLGHALMQLIPDALGFDINGKNVIDITDERSVKSVFAKVKPDGVINAAAYTNVDGAEEDFRSALSINTIGANYLLCSCIDHNATYVHLSTDYVFDGQLSDGYAENFNDYDPLNKYGISKMLTEIVIKALAYPNVYLVRTAWLYGPNGKNFVDTILKAAAQKPELKVVNDQFGCPTFARDLADFIYQLLKKKYPYGIYHAVNGGKATWYDLASEAIRLKGLKTKVMPCTSEEFPRPAKRPKYSVLLKTKDQPPMRDWKEALADYLS